jgi:hypothetical protein
MCDASNHVAVAAPAPTAPLVSEPSPPKLSGPEHSPPYHPMPESLLPCYSPIPSPPPAKRTRKNPLLLSPLLLFPLHDLPPPPALSPLSTPITSMMLRTPLPLSPPEQGPSTPIQATRSTLRQLPHQQTSSHPRLSLSLHYPRLKPWMSTPVQFLVTANGPPPPPPWPESNVFSNDPDCIICHKCCKWHYNLRWYNHCFVCAI